MKPDMTAKETDIISLSAQAQHEIQWQCWC